MQQVSTILNAVRAITDNDWVTFTVLGCICVIIFTLQSLNREAGLRDFFLQDYADAPNVTSSWTLVSVVFCVLLSVLLSPYVPVVPKIFSEYGVLGFSLNKFGFTFLSIAGMMLGTTILSFFFFMSVDAGSNREQYFFHITKYYLGVSLLLIPSIISYYYFGIIREQALMIYLGILGFVFIFKAFYLLLSKGGILPGKWYYKILYICTLQIVPALVLWRVLFL